MIIQSQVSVEEYLRTSSEPDCEYVRGRIVERAIPERSHSEWQAALLYGFSDREREWNLIALPSLRIRVATDEYRVPDVSILSRSAPHEQIITHPPVAVFEVLSPEDTMTGTLEKLESYQRMGIPAIWVIDPKTDQKIAASWQYSSGKLTPISVFELPGTGLRVAINELCALIN